MVSHSYSSEQRRYSLSHRGVKANVIEVCFSMANRQAQNSFSYELRINV